MHSITFYARFSLCSLLLLLFFAEGEKESWKFSVYYFYGSVISSLSKYFRMENGEENVIAKR